MRKIEHPRAHLLRAVHYRYPREDRISRKGPRSKEAQGPNESLATRDYCCTVFTMIGVVIISTDVISISVSSRSKLPLKGTGTS